MEKEIRLISVSHVGDQIVFSGDQRAVERALRVQDLLINLMSDEGEQGVEEENQSFQYLTTKKVDIPPLFVGGGQSQGMDCEESGALHSSFAESTGSREGWRS